MRERGGRGAPQAARAAPSVSRSGHPSPPLFSPCLTSSKASTVRATREVEGSGAAKSAGMPALLSARPTTASAAATASSSPVMGGPPSPVAPRRAGVADRERGLGSSRLTPPRRRSGRGERERERESPRRRLGVRDRDRDRDRRRRSLPRAMVEGLKVCVWVRCVCATGKGMRRGHY